MRGSDASTLDAAWAAAGEAIANALRLQFSELAGREKPTVERSYSVPELSDISGIPQSTLRQLVASGELPVFSVTGGSRGNRVLESDWLAFCGEGGRERAGA